MFLCVAGGGEGLVYEYMGVHILQKQDIHQYMTEQVWNRSGNCEDSVPNRDGSCSYLISASVCPICLCQFLSESLLLCLYVSLFLTLCLFVCLCVCQSLPSCTGWLGVKH